MAIVVPTTVPHLAATLLATVAAEEVRGLVRAMSREASALARLITAGTGACLAVDASRTGPAAMPGAAVTAGAVDAGLGGAYVATR